MTRKHRQALSDQWLMFRRWIAARGTPGQSDPAIVIARILGNDLVPRHQTGQMLANLQFVLSREPDFVGVGKLFVLNRIFDPKVEQEADEMITAAGYQSLILPFVAEEYAALGLNTASFGGLPYFGSPEFEAQGPAMRAQKRIWALAPKIGYAMNINGARNAALEAGQSVGAWTAVLDGGCMFTAASFAAFQDTVRANAHLPAVVIPMDRIADNEETRLREPGLLTGEEPQIAFAPNTTLRFDPRMVYGIRDKSALLKALGVPGLARDRARHDWTGIAAAPYPERHRFAISQGGVFRLTSPEGRNLDDGGAGHSARYQSRNAAILATIAHLDATTGSKSAKRAKRILNDPDPDHGKTRKRFRMRPGFRESDAPIDRLAGRRLFIGLGAQKSGTSWVSDYLRAHPDAYHSPIKEMNFLNSLDKNPMRRFGPKGRLTRMSDTMLGPGWHWPINPSAHDRLRALAEIAVMRSDTDYLRYFARRIGRETVFGEICPQYALIPPKTYKRIADMGIETRLMLFMRDPTERLASNLRHVSRKRDIDYDARIDALDARSVQYLRSDYLVPIRNLVESGTDLPLKVFVFEELFNDAAMGDLCDFLGIAPRPAKTDRVSNPGSGPKLTDAQKDRIREILDPVYRDLDAHFGDNRPKSWRWTL